MELLAVVIAVVAVVVVFFGVRSVVRHDRDAKERAGLRSDEDLRAENLKTREEHGELARKHDKGIGGFIG